MVKYSVWSYVRFLFYYWRSHGAHSLLVAFKDFTASMKHLEVVEIWWVDSAAEQAWTPRAELSDGKPIPAIGILAHESSEFVTLAISVDSDSDEYIPTLSIPKVAIKKRKTLCRIKLK